MKRMVTRKFDVAAKMPPLRHSSQEGEFDIEKSRALQWLLHQPDIMTYVWMKAINLGKITYDRETGLWSGIDYKEDGR